eukprot:TRINITY_DN35640_c0_g1_i1.p1 TRINITY_DN35640_c0_g1~~TRINITY_DN35640_c0_g1_i1.p1  ORF type:complete len:239 (-),score=33.54 TRINITY_DN35640_c0_g1_i1:863-1579(-)
MGQVAGKTSKPILVEQAKMSKTDTAVLDQLRTTLKETGNVVTFRPLKGSHLNKDRNVYAGDLSVEDKQTLLQIRPLVVLEYNGSSHTAVVKHGVTGEILMRLVRELNDDPWYGGGKNADSLRCSIGGNTEPRLYVNGRPVAVDCGRNFMSCVPTPSATADPLAELGASMVELLKKVDGRNGMELYRRKNDNSPGSHVATYTRVRNGTAAVLKMASPEAPVVDPLTLLVIVWFVMIEQS